MSKSKSGRSAKVRPSEMTTVPVRPAVRIVKGALDPRDLDLLVRWIELNKDVLTAYWDGTIEYTEGAIAEIRPIGLASR